MFDLTFPLHNIVKQGSLVCAVSLLIMTNQTQIDVIAASATLVLTSLSICHCHYANFLAQIW